jgi:hypothetical protein
MVGIRRRGHGERGRGRVDVNRPGARQQATLRPTHGSKTALFGTLRQRAAYFRTRAAGPTAPASIRSSAASAASPPREGDEVEGK